MIFYHNAIHVPVNLNTPSYEQKVVMVLIAMVQENNCGNSPPDLNAEYSLAELCLLLLLFLCKNSEVLGDSLVALGSDLCRPTW